MDVSSDLKVEMLRRMHRIRLFEERALQGLKEGEVPGGIHTSVGMEASNVGACMALRLDDYIVGTHRSHGHPIAKGAAIGPLFAELMGKVTGINQGKGGSQHLSDFSVGSLGETSIVGSGLPVATGAALACKMKKLDRISLCFFGDGAAGEGTFHESLNLGSLWKLPVVYVCENNMYGELTAFANACSSPDIACRAAGYSMPGVKVDGQDVLAVYEAVRAAVDRARGGGGPSLIETQTYRYHNHAGGPDGGMLGAMPAPIYRTVEEVEQWKLRDPIRLFRDRLIAEQVLTEADAQTIEEHEQKLIVEAWEFGRLSPYPPKSATYDHMYTNPLPTSR